MAGERPRGSELPALSPEEMAKLARSLGSTIKRWNRTGETSGGQQVNYGATLHLLIMRDVLNLVLGRKDFIEINAAGFPLRVQRTGKITEDPRKR